MWLIWVWLRIKQRRWTLTASCNIEIFSGDYIWHTAHRPALILHGHSSLRLAGTTAHLDFSSRRCFCRFSASGHSRLAVTLRTVQSRKKRDREKRLVRLFRIKCTSTCEWMSNRDVCALTFGDSLFQSVVCKEKVIKPRPGDLACSKRAPFPCLHVPSGCRFIPPLLQNADRCLLKEQKLKTLRPQKSSSWAGFPLKGTMNTSTGNSAEKQRGNWGGWKM